MELDDCAFRCSGRRSTANLDEGFRGGELGVARGQPAAASKDGTQGPARVSTENLIGQGGQFKKRRP